MSDVLNGEDGIPSEEDTSQAQVMSTVTVASEASPVAGVCTNPPNSSPITSGSHAATPLQPSVQTMPGSDSVETKLTSPLPDLKLIYFNKADPETKASTPLPIQNGISPKVVQLPGGGTGGGGYAYVGTIIKQGKDVSEGQKVLLTPVIKEGSRFILPKGAGTGGNPVRSSIVANSSSSPIILSHGQQTRRSFLIHNSALGVSKEVKVPKVLPPAKVPLMVCSTRPHDVTLTSVKPLEISSLQSPDSSSEKTGSSDSSPFTGPPRDMPPLTPIRSPTSIAPTSATSVSQSESDDVELVSEGDMPRPIVKRSLLKTCKLSDLLPLSSPISIPDSPTKSEESPENETLVESESLSGDGPDAKETFNDTKSPQDKPLIKKIENENLENGEKSKAHQISPTCKLFVSSQSSLTNDSLKKFKGDLSSFKMTNSNGHFVRILSACNNADGRELSGKHVNALLLKDGKAVVLGTLPKDPTLKEQVTENPSDKTEEASGGSKQDALTIFSIQNKVQKTFPLVVSPSQEHRNSNQDATSKSEDSVKPIITVRGLSSFPNLIGNIHVKEGLQVKELSKEGAMLERSRKRKGAPLLRDCFRKTIAVKRLELLSGAASLHPLQVIDWDMKTSVGSLPGSDIKFVVNRYGALQVYEGDDSKQIISKPPSKGMEVVYAGGEQSGKDEIGKCTECECYGLLVEFIEERFCSLSCRERNQTRKALVSKRTLSALTKDNTNKKRKLFELALNKSRPVDEDMDTKVKPVELSSEECVDVETISSPSALTTALRQPIKAGEAMKAAQRLLAPPLPTKEEQLKDEPPTQIPVPEEKKPQRERKASTDSVVKSNIPGPAANLTNTDKSEKFDWCEYLSQMRSHPAWVRLFKDAFPSQPNLFKVGHRLEAVDPQRPSLFCVASVSAVKGYRIKLHFDGYGKAHDFWLNADSPNIFPCGFCSSHGIELEPPWGFNKQTFVWSKYLINIKAKPAPPRCFVHKLMDSGEPNLFKVGMKLEAVDKKNSYLVCVATVAGVVDHRILIHFDSWDESYDYWTEYYSPNIHPVGWCQRNNYLLTPPNGHKRKTFSWKRYLMETGSEAAPESAFMVRPPIKFKKGSKLEAVDPRAAHLIRVATVKQVLPYQVHVVYDGFPDHFGYWFDDDSPDLHPIGWCNRTGHPLTPPPKSNTSRACSTPGCFGEGNACSGDLENHSDLEYCPYSIDNLDEDNLIPDRLSISKSGSKSSDGKKDVNLAQKNVRKVKEGPKTADAEDSNTSTFVVPNPVSVPSPAEPPQAEESSADTLPASVNQNPSATPTFIKLEPVDEEETPSDLPPSSPSQPVLVNEEVLKAACDKFVSGNLSRVIRTSEVMAEELLAWDSKKVTAFVEALLHRATNAFYNNKVDGEGLLMLNEEDLSQRMRFNKAEVSMIYSNIVTLRDKFALQSK